MARPQSRTGAWWPFTDYDYAANRAMIFAVFDKLKWLQPDPDISVKETAAPSS